MYSCECCGEVFYEPIRRRVSENLDGENGWWSGIIQLCPFCGSDYVEEVEDAKDENG